MEVFHGTFLEAAESIRTDGILLSKCKPHTDFGKGFYVTEHREYAERTALKKSRKSASVGKVLVPAVVVFEYDTVQGAYLEHHFAEEDVQWLQFIINNRAGEGYVQQLGMTFHNISARQEIVSGRVADQDIFFLASELKKKPRLANETDLKNVVYKNNPYATQISFHTPAALKTLRYEEYYVVKEDACHA